MSLTRVTLYIISLCLIASAGAQTQTPRVVIATGTLQGVSLPSRSGGGVFLGIPFATQPVGDLRWKAPQAAPNWKGIRKALDYGPACPQFPSPWLPEMLGVQKMVTDEACLFVNVWTPELHPKAKLPVFVWVHGGGNVEGAGNWPPLGEALAERGVVVVSLNYRLGALGYLASSWLADESDHHTSGNYGQLDQIAALRWVRENIAAFGGNAQRVTIGGESSGALDVCNLMSSPLAAGLFQQVILQSGVCVDSVYPTARASEADGTRLAKDLGVSPGPEGLKALRAVPADRILQATKDDPNLDLEPVVDGWVFPQQPAITFAEGKQAHVRVLVGSNDNEVSIFASPIVGGRSSRPDSVAAYRQWLQKRFKNDADEVFADYPAHSDGEARRAFETMYTDFDFGFGAWLLANDMTQVKQPAFLYHFNYAGAGKFAALGAFHSEELMFLSRKYWTSWVSRPEDKVLSDAIVGYWAGFIKDGSPSGPKLPAWPAWSSNGMSQLLGSKIESAAAPRAQYFAVFQRYLNSRLQNLPH